MDRYMTIIQEYLLQIILLTAGILLFIRTLWSLARKKLTETLSMFWSVVAILLVVAGLLLIPLNLSQYITHGALILVAVGFALMFEGMFFLSIHLSFTTRKTQELAIQISLLNQEHIKVDECLSGLSGQSRNQIWRTSTVAELTVVQAQKEGTSIEECAVCN